MLPAPPLLPVSVKSNRGRHVPRAPFSERKVNASATSADLSPRTGDLGPWRAKTEMTIRPRDTLTRGIAASICLTRCFERIPRLFLAPGGCSSHLRRHWRMVALPQRKVSIHLVGRTPRCRCERHYASGWPKWRSSNVIDTDLTMQKESADRYQARAYLNATRRINCSNRGSVRMRSSQGSRFNQTMQSQRSTMALSNQRNASSASPNTA